MKTNRFARRIRKLRIVLFCAFAAGIAVAGYHLGDHLKERSAKAAATAELLPVPNVSLHELMASAR